MAACSVAMTTGMITDGDDDRAAAILDSILACKWDQYKGYECSVSRVSRHSFAIERNALLVSVEEYENLQIVQQIETQN